MPLLPHDYLSTACLHGFHDYCKHHVPLDGKIRTPAECTFCGSSCICECHKEKK